MFFDMEGDRVSEEESGAKYFKKILGDRNIHGDSRSISGLNRAEGRKQLNIMGEQGTFEKYGSKASQYKG